ncbi:hypothetical protein [Sodalis sp.]|uniref:hypothetical protein n=1 Tax=Sodalis sp. (in: enterobacteria) TaxID=1898979 RepID=UPI0038739B23
MARPGRAETPARLRCFGGSGGGTSPAFTRRAGAGDATLPARGNIQFRVVANAS